MEHLRSHPALEHLYAPVVLHVFLDRVEAVEGGLDDVGRDERFPEQRREFQLVDRQEPFTALVQRPRGACVYARQPFVDFAQLSLCVLVLCHPDGVVVAALELGTVHLGQVRLDVAPLVDHAPLVLEFIAEPVLQGTVEACPAVGHENDVGVQREAPALHVGEERAAHFGVFRTALPEAEHPLVAIRVDAYGGHHDLAAAVHGVHEDGHRLEVLQPALVQFPELFRAGGDDLARHRRLAHAERLAGGREHVLVAPPGQAGEACVQQVLGECAGVFQAGVDARLDLAVFVPEPGDAHLRLAARDVHGTALARPFLVAVLRVVRGPA